MTESVFTAASASTYTLYQSKLLLDPVNQRTFLDGIINSLPEVLVAFSQLVFFSVYIGEGDLQALAGYCENIILQYAVTVIVPYSIFIHGIRDAVNKHVYGIYNAALVYAVYTFLFSFVISFLAGLVLFFFRSGTLFGKLLAIFGFVSYLLLKEMIIFGQYTGYRDRSLCLAALYSAMFSILLYLLQIIGYLGETATIIAFIVPSLFTGCLGLYYSLPSQDQSLAIDFKQLLPLRPKLLVYLLVTSYSSLVQAVSQILVLALSICLARRCDNCGDAMVVLYYFLVIWQFSLVLKNSFGHYSFVFYNINYAAKRADRLGFFYRRVFLPYLAINLVYAAIWFLITTPILYQLGSKSSTTFAEKYLSILKMSALTALLPGNMLDFNSLGVYKITYAVSSSLAILATIGVFLTQFFAFQQENPLNTIFCYQLVYYGTSTVFIAVTYAATFYLRKMSNYTEALDATEQEPRRISQTSQYNQNSQQSQQSQTNNSFHQNVQFSGIPALRASCSYANYSQRSDNKDMEKQASQSDMKV